MKRKLLDGGYDSAHGIDNIVADQDQYDAVMDNAGAQFIQHILSTRTLVHEVLRKQASQFSVCRRDNLQRIEYLLQRLNV